MATEDELVAARRAHIERLKAVDFQPYPLFRADESAHARRRAFVALAQDEEARASLPSEEELEGTTGEIYPLFGRAVAKRGPFLVVRTPQGDAQALVRPELLDEASKQAFEVLDLADHVWVEGPAMRTKTGAAAIRARVYRPIAKALLPPPAKWHGLKDIEKRYRERYVDLFANPSVASLFRARSAIVRALRSFLDARGFVEVETPLLHSLRGGATAKPFTTHHNALDLDLFLRIAPELYLKRLLVGGFERVYEIGRNFRNEGLSPRHNPEFTMLEFYQAYATKDDLIELAETMIRQVDRALDDFAPQDRAARSFDLDAPWERITLLDAADQALDRLLQGAAGVEDLEAAGARGSLESLRHKGGKLLERARRFKLSEEEQKRLRTMLERGSRGELAFTLFEIAAEPRLCEMFRTSDGERSRAVFITDYPREVSPLARPYDHDPEWTDRFELFIEGREVANAFSELNDPDMQAERFQAQLAQRAGGDEEAMDFDHDYIRALSHGMPPAAGLGLGVDRLVMLLCNQSSIRDVLLFPLLRPEAE